MWPSGQCALLRLSPRHPHQPHAIAQVVLQGPGDAAAQIGRSGLACSAAGSGADQGLTGHLDQILPLHQREQAPGGGGSEGIGEGQVLQHQGIAGPQGRTAESWGLLCGGRGKRGKPSAGRRRTPPPPAGRSAAARTPTPGRLARSLTRREDWPRDAVGVRRPGGQPSRPRRGRCGEPPR